MRRGLRGQGPGIPGFFLMEVMVLVIVFISFSLVLVGWYSSFSSMKATILKRGQAIFIASNALELIRIQGSIPSEIYSPPGFNVSYTSDILSKNHCSTSFAEVTVCVDFSDSLAPVSLTTGIVLRCSSKIIEATPSVEPDISNDESKYIFLADSEGV